MIIMTDSEPIQPHPRYRYLVDLLHHEVYDTTKAKSLKYLVDNLTDENWKLRKENTELKLMLNEVVRDLEKQSESTMPILISKEYVEWIKSECNLEFTSQK